mmetsp:Transcript_26664/g.63955  ORF Transcript_26664/g.63955 Transcript_26664/m.63955 type:complete len:256 (-) Transcript_26664:247-1014(-)
MHAVRAVHSQRPPRQQCRPTLDRANHHGRRERPRQLPVHLLARRRKFLCQLDGNRGRMTTAGLQRGSGGRRRDDPAVVPQTARLGVHRERLPVRAGGVALVLEPYVARQLLSPVRRFDLLIHDGLLPLSIRVPVFLPLGIAPPHHPQVLIVRPIVHGQASDEGKVHAEAAMRAGAVQAQRDAIRDARPVGSRRRAAAFDARVVGGEGAKEGELLRGEGAGGLGRGINAHVVVGVVVVAAAAVGSSIIVLLRSISI